MVSRQTTLLAVAVLFILSLATRTEAVTSLQVNTTAATQASATNQALAQALAKLLRTNGTHVNVTIQPPFPFNATVKADTIRLARQLLQQLLKAQPLWSVMQQILKPTSNSPARALLAEDDGSSVVSTSTNTSGTDTVDGSSSNGNDTLLTTNTTTMTTTTTANSSTGKTPTQVTNARKVAARINVIMSDAWLVTYSGFKVAQVSVQLLAAMLSAGSSGTVTVDSALTLKFADVSSNFMSTVAYLLYGIQKLTADAVAPLGVVKTVTRPPL